MSQLNVASPSYLIAIDPGSHQMGVAVFRDGELLESFTIKGPAKGKDVDQRAWEMLIDLEAHLPWGPLFDYVTMAYEDPQYMQIAGSARPVSQLYRLVGHMDQWARGLEWKVVKYAVNDIKWGVAGRPGGTGHSKAEVEAVLRHELNLHDAVKTDHEWDAISVGVYHLQMERVRGAMQ